MDKWKGKVAVVTGTSSGIGEAIVRDLVSYGLKVVALARRQEKQQKLEDELRRTGKGEIKALKCDICDDRDVSAAFKWISDNWGGISILVNNAGVFVPCDIPNGNEADWRKIMDTNMMKPCLLMKHAIESIKSHNNGIGYIININSVAGQRIITTDTDMFSEVPVGVRLFYGASKYALRVVTEYLRLQLGKENPKIRVTSISPGNVLTEMGEQYIDKMKTAHLLPEDISQGVIYVLSTPERVNVSELIIQPVGEGF